MLFDLSSPPGMDESGYAVRWFAVRVAEAQLPALPERTCPFTRRARADCTSDASPNCPWLGAVGVLALRSSWISPPLNE